MSVARELKTIGVRKDRGPCKRRQRRKTEKHRSSTPNSRKLNAIFFRQQDVKCATLHKPDEFNGKR